MTKTVPGTPHGRIGMAPHVRGGRKAKARRIESAKGRAARAYLNSIPYDPPRPAKS